MSEPKIASREQWLQARLTLMTREKELTQLREDIARQRRELPWVKVDDSYGFENEEGRVSLSQLFAGCSQLIVYHFMFGEDWQAGCPSCSFWADNYNGTVAHLNARDIHFVAVSTAPSASLQAYKQRMAWSFDWYSCGESDFNSDFGVTFSEQQIAAGKNQYNFGTSVFNGPEAPGLSVFAKDESGDVYHTYSCYARGLDTLNGAYHHMDLVPKGRDEKGLPFSMAWLKRNDEY